MTALNNIHKKFTQHIGRFKFSLLVFIMVAVFSGTTSFVAADNTKGPYQCGSGANAVATSISFGCKGDSCVTSGSPAASSGFNCAQDNSAILDATFAIIRFLSDGVGLAVIGSIIYAGIQYTSSAGDPNLAGKAKKRIKSSISALILFIFAYAILNYIIPAGFFN